MSVTFLYALWKLCHAASSIRFKHRSPNVVYSAQVKDKGICHDEGGWISQHEVISNPFVRASVGGKLSNLYAQTRSVSIQEFKTLHTVTKEEVNVS